MKNPALLLEPDMIPDTSDYNGMYLKTIEPKLQNMKLLKAKHVIFSSIKSRPDLIRQCLADITTDSSIYTSGHLTIDEIWFDLETRSQNSINSNIPFHCTIKSRFCWRIRDTVPQT